eukprot:TRINITY_DN2049_c0_g1_i1.p1 TRINITY_DN2049_c0_g1~~TRINITY_DN2049_c0_g1_i1.p1  ORF type:complete len:169 (+),score=59.71 TRINITY_DN2049_c0_g1_i1:62-508(+)
MGRSRTSSRSSSSRSRSSSPASSSSSSSKSAHSNQQQHQPTPAAQPSQPVHHAPQGPGLMTQIAANAASIAGGHVLAHTIIGAMEGRGDRGSPEQHAAPAATASAASSSRDQCTGPFRAFNDCMKESDNDISLCQWAFDALKRCQGSS